MRLEKILLLVPVVGFLFCGWIVAPQWAKSAVINVWLGVIVSSAFILILGLFVGVWWLYHKARQSTYIQPDPNGNFPLVPMGRGRWRNLNLTDAELNEWAWAVWQMSTSKTSQPNLDKGISPYAPPRLIGSDEDDVSAFVLEGKAEVSRL